jgi:hypothetical protein
MGKKERLKTKEEHDCVISSLQRNQRAKLDDRIKLRPLCTGSLYQGWGIFCLADHVTCGHISLKM